jgi:hypothetical protein
MPTHSLGEGGKLMYVGSCYLGYSCIMLLIPFACQQSASC